MIHQLFQGLLPPFSDTLMCTSSKVIKTGSSPCCWKLTLCTATCRCLVWLQGSLHPVGRFHVKYVWFKLIDPSTRWYFHAQNWYHARNDKCFCFYLMETHPMISGHAKTIPCGAMSWGHHRLALWSARRCALSHLISVANHRHLDHFILPFFLDSHSQLFFWKPHLAGFLFFSSTWVSGKHKPKSLVPGPCHGGCRGGTITDPALEPRGGTMTSCGWSKIHHFKGTTWGFYGIQWGYGNIVTSRWILWDMNGPKKTTTFRMLLSILILGELVSFNVERSSEFNGPISAVYNISILRRPTPNFWFWPWTPCSGLLSPDTRLHIPQIGDTL
jgi:hypothetical protein